MFYDNASYLRQVFHTFMNANPDLLTQFCDVFSGAEVPTDAIREVFSSRFEHWLDTRSGVTDKGHRATLRQMATAVAELATVCEATETGVYT